MDYHEQELERRRQAAKENALRVAFPDRYKAKEQDDLQTKNVEAKPKARKSKATDKPVFIEQPTVAVASYEEPLSVQSTTTNEEPLSVQSSDHSTDGDRRGQ
jgi:hypothetical protein